MSRKIVLLSDGTGNSAAKVWRTNVWRTFEALDLSGNDQVAFYDDGVGTSTFKPWAILGGAFGFGLKRNVIDIYKFACRNARCGSPVSIPTLAAVTPMTRWPISRWSGCSPRRNAAASN
jgi:uncharacterized protein (DUF2235 family)